VDSWGIHVTRSGDGKAKGSEMEDYTRQIGFNKLVVECGAMG
jgi:hypothetical protein